MRTLDAIKSISLGLLAVMVLQGCGDSDKSENKNSDSSALSITPSAATVLPNGSVQFSATGGTGPYYYYISTGSSLGSLNTSGLFTAGSSVGNVTILVQDSAGHLGYASVTISTSATGLTVSPSSTSVNYGASVQLTAAGGTAPYTFSITSGASLGYITSTGIFTAYNTAGTASIQVQDSSGKSGAATVTVSTTGGGGSGHGYINAISKVYNTIYNACDFKIEWVMFDSNGSGSVVLVSDTPTGPQSLFSCMDDHNGEAHSMQTGGTWPGLGSSATFKLYNASCPSSSSNVVMSSSPVAQVTVTCTQ